MDQTDYTWEFDNPVEEIQVPTDPPLPDTDEPFKYMLCLGRRRLHKKRKDVGAVTFPVTRCGSTVTITFSSLVSERFAVDAAEKHLSRTIDFDTWQRNTKTDDDLKKYTFEQLYRTGYRICDLVGAWIYLDAVSVKKVLPGGGKHIELVIGS